ncbi:MAG TPA: 3-deoxy-D-manno-octulosonic acid transferase [Candidatus Limnocylindrales bacterium]|nr:3-deoxy-D-manno-octulosonic acid transferase [Candidatus Limnocylindrales bacterium]
MYFLYRILTTLSVVVLVPYYVVRGWRRGETSRAVLERMGRLSRESIPRKAAQRAIWVHAVSVGEVLAAKPLVVGLRQRHPDRSIYVSTTTETGQRLAQERLRCADGVFYFPLDSVTSVRRALEAVDPGLVIVMETEIWPNFLREAKRRGIPVVFANARISARSFHRYQTWSFLVGDFYRRVLADADLFLTQTPEDGDRLRDMGAAEERIVAVGNLKYDAEPPGQSELGNWLKAQIQEQERWPVLVAGSVAGQEEEAVLAAYDLVQRRWRRALLILAPRKPDRFDGAAAIVEEGGWNLVRRSHIDLREPLDEQADAILLDSIGELGGLYALADAAFVGGSLVSVGGHNILEPAWFGRPPVFGPSMENFQQMSEQFLAARAAVQVGSGAQLGKVWMQMIEDPALREKMGNAARLLAERNRGATQRCIERLAPFLEDEAPLS